MNKRQYKKAKPNKRQQFIQCNANLLNNINFIELSRLAMSRFEYENLPLSIDLHYFKKQLFLNGKVVFYIHPITKRLTVSNVAYSGGLNIYNQPVQYEAVNIVDTTNVNIHNSVIMYDNIDEISSYTICRLFAERMTNIDMAINSQVNALKVPFIIRTSKENQLTAKNIFAQFMNNEPAIIVDDSYDIDSNFQVINTGVGNGSHDIVNQLLIDKAKLKNECLTMLGIDNANMDKKERLVADEVNANNDSVLINRNSFVQSRNYAIEKINKIFKMNIQLKQVGSYRTERVDLESGVKIIE